MGLGTRESLPLSLSQGEPGIAGFKGEPGPKGEPVSICCGVPGNIPMPGWTQVGQPQLTQLDLYHRCSHGGHCCSSLSPSSNGPALRQEPRPLHLPLTG